MINYHADDYGVSVNASRDILSLVCQDKLTGISVIPNMSCFEECMKLLLSVMEHKPNLSVALHLNFFEGHCCAEPERIPLLVDKNGYFMCSWVQLFKDSFSTKRNCVRKQLSIEIHAQIEKWIAVMREEYILCIDSHQHSHMIPVVWDALRDTILCHHYRIEYIRNSREPLYPYLLIPSLYASYPPANLIKNVIMQFCALHIRKSPILSTTDQYYLWGLIMGGSMDWKRISILMPKFRKYGENDNTLELLFHPGSVLQEELSAEYNNPDFVKAETSPKRRAEYESLMKL